MANDLIEFYDDLAYFRALETQIINALSALSTAEERIKYIVEDSAIAGTVSIGSANVQTR